MRRWRALSGWIFAHFAPPRGAAAGCYCTIDQLLCAQSLCVDANRRYKAKGSAMARNPRFDVLFEPVRIGPVTAPNRFYQVPHASGMTNALPQVRATFRETKAEGGWGVVCTGAVSIHPSSDDSPLPFASLWDDKDIRAHALMTDAVHRQDSLAGIELWHGGACTLNRTSRLAPLSPSGMPWMSTHVGFMGNLRPRTMDASDIQ